MKVVEGIPDFLREAVWPGIRSRSTIPVTDPAPILVRPEEWRIP